jgi:hypothetical protein
MTDTQRSFVPGMPAYSEVQVIHDIRQVISPMQLLPGETYIAMHGPVSVLELKHLAARNGLFEARPKHGNRSTYFLSDHGIMPSEEGWNAIDFLIMPQMMGYFPLKGRSHVNGQASYICVEYLGGSGNAVNGSFFYGPLTNAGVRLLMPWVDLKHRSDNSSTITRKSVLGSNSPGMRYVDPSRISTPRYLIDSFEVRPGFLNGFRRY